MRITTIATVLAVFSLTADPYNLLAEEFTRKDTIIILVSGPPALTTPWGLSSKSSMYRGNQSTVEGSIGFEPVKGSQDIQCERRSAKKIDDPFDYSAKGQIPPGIYFLSYRRFDVDMGKVRARHRLVMGDDKNGVSIMAPVGNKSVERTQIQFHVSDKELKVLDDKQSEGCVTFTSENFVKLFPKEFLDPAQSPLHGSVINDPAASKFKGDGQVLVFVTDVTNPERNKRQLELFQSIVNGGKGGLKPDNFESDSAELKTLRQSWRTP